jgi:hypothetical protein
MGTTFGKICAMADWQKTSTLGLSDVLSSNKSTLMCELAAVLKIHWLFSRVKNFMAKEILEMPIETANREDYLPEKSNGRIVFP